MIPIRWAPFLIVGALVPAASASASSSSGALLAAAKSRQTTKAAPRQTKESLTQELQGLGGVPGGRSRTNESLYVVQERHSDLRHRLGVMVGAGTNLAGDVYTDSTENSLSLLFYFNNRLFTAVHGAQVYNELTESGEEAFEDEGIFPNAAFVTTRADLTLGYNLIYGKARVTRDTMFYFDQYVAIGGGIVRQSDGLTETQSPAAVAETGVTFWFGRALGIRTGLRGMRFQENRRQDSSRINHLVGYGSVGYLFGG